MRPVIPVSNMHWPREGARALPFTAVFTASIAAVNFDLAQEMEQGLIQLIQSVFIDNSANTATFQLQTLIGFEPVNIIVPLHGQGWFPVMIENGAARLTASIPSAAAIAIPLVFLNVAMPYFTWKTQ